MAVALVSGPHYDYHSYMAQWARALAGHNPWLNDPRNAYGPGHELLAPFFFIHPLLPKAVFVLSWFGCFIVVFEAAGRDAMMGLASFLTLFATPFFDILVCFFGVEDILVAFLTLLAIDLKVRKAQEVAPALLLAFAALIKVYPLAISPFLATERGAIDRRFLRACLSAVAGGLLLTIALWGNSVVQVVQLAATREGKMLSIFWYLSESRFSPLAGTGLTRTLSNWNLLVLFAAMATAYACHVYREMRALTGALIASIVVLAFYKVGNPQYFILPSVLVIYLLAVRAHQGAEKDCGLLVAAGAYLLVLNGFELWYAVTHSHRFPQVRAAIGLPCFLASLLLAWRVMRDDLRRRGPGQQTRPGMTV
jgi:hypothetical protein